MSDPLKNHVWNVISKLDGWCDQGRANMLIDLVLNHRPKVCVEIGVFGGRSLIAMGFALQHLGHGGYITGIDPWSVEAAIEGESEKNVEWWSQSVDLEKIYANFAQNIINLKLTYHCRWIRAKAEEVAAIYPENSINLLSLDGNHSELASTREVQMWLPRIAPQGVIVIDDTDWTTQAKAIQMIREAGFRNLYDAGSWMAFQKP